MDKSALFQITYGLYVLSAKKEDGFSGCIVNTVVQTTDEPLTITVTVNKKNETCESIQKSGEFLVSVLPKEVDPFVISNFGFQSGRTADKWANVKHETKADLPVISNASAYYYCRVESVKELPTHMMFTCSVEDAWLGQGEPITYAYYQANVKEKSKEAFESFKGMNQNESTQGKWVCKICGYIYDGEIPFEQLPDNWTCPWCNHPKSDFEKR